jgi:RNA polymerase sigma-70 factor (ECF subfamily)
LECADFQRRYSYARLGSATRQLVGPTNLDTRLDKNRSVARHSGQSMLAAPDLERLYDAHASALFGFLLQLTRSEADTRDLLQQAFVRLAARPNLLDGVRDERAFLLRLAHNAFVDLTRRRHTRQRYHDALAAEPVELFAATADPDAAAWRAELEAALAELPAEQRAVVHLKLWEGLTFEAIAGLLDIPLNTAASRYRYGVDKLRARLRPLYDEIQ